jgi:DNA-binding beta-propeller fold protein YncE/tetratricopeptide (TPR) repeat protein
MKHINQQTIAVFVLLFFIPAITIEAYPLTAVSSEKEGLELMEAGEKLFKDNDYEGALTKFQKAAKLISTSSNRLRLRLHGNMAYLLYSLGREEEAEKCIEEIIKIKRDFKIEIEGGVPPGFLRLFNEIRESFSQDKTPFNTNVIMKKGKKKKRKFPVWVIPIAAFAVWGLLKLLSNKGDSSQNGNPDGGNGTGDNKAMLNFKSEPTGAEVIVDEEKRGETPCSFELDTGSYEIKLKKPGFGESTETVTVEKGKNLEIMVTLAPYTYDFVTKWGNQGKSSWQLNQPEGVAVDKNGEFVYVTDTSNHRFIKFNTNGVDEGKWGKKGKEKEEFLFPSGIVVDAQGNIYIADKENHRVKKYNSRVVCIEDWGGYGGPGPRGDGKFNIPIDIAVDNNGFVYVSDHNNHRIQVFDESGGFQEDWGTEGGDAGEFNKPYGIAYRNGEVYVADHDGNRIQKFHNDGSFIFEWGTEGIGEGEFNKPAGIAIDNRNYVYVTDMKNNRVQKFDLNGKFLCQWGRKGHENGEFFKPKGIAVDVNNYVYVCDTNNHRIQKFKMSDTETYGHVPWEINTTSTSSSTSSKKCLQPIGQKSNRQKKPTNRKKGPLKK